MPEETATNDTASKFESGKTHAKHAAEDLRAAATAKAQELRDTAQAKAQEFRETAQAKAQEFSGKAKHHYGHYREHARTFREDGEQYVRENPTRAVFTALGIGFVLGLIFRR